MILTCPRCATRYLADPLQVWATGRTVECEACGQRWRAVGEGVRPAPPPEPATTAAPPPQAALHPEPAPDPGPALDVVGPGVAEPASEAMVASPSGDAPAAGPADTVATAPPESEPEVQPESRVAREESRHDGDTTHAPMPTATTDDEPLTREYLFRRPPPPPARSFPVSVGAGSWLAIAFLMVIALAAFVMFRDVIVEVLPGLAPVYAAMGLLVHPAAVPHG